MIGMSGGGPSDSVLKQKCVPKQAQVALFGTKIPHCTSDSSRAKAKVTHLMRKPE